MGAGRPDASGLTSPDTTKVSSTGVDSSSEAPQPTRNAPHASASESHGLGRVGVMPSPLALAGSGERAPIIDQPIPTDHSAAPTCGQSHSSHASFSEPVE